MTLVFFIVISEYAEGVFSFHQFCPGFRPLTPITKFYFLRSFSHLSETIDMGVPGRVLWTPGSCPGVGLEVKI